MGQSPIATGQLGFGEQFPGEGFIERWGQGLPCWERTQDWGFLGVFLGWHLAVLGFDAVVLRKQIKGHF